MPLSRLVAFPFAIIFGLLLYYLLDGGDEKYSWWLIPNGLILITIYVFHHQINWYGYQRKPPKLDEAVIKMYMLHLPFLRQLSKEELDRFFMRTSMWVKAKEFHTKGLDNLPEEVKYMLAAYPVYLTLHKENFLLSPFDRYVAYPHPFMSPQFEDHIHTVEHEDRDGVLVFSLEQFIPGFLRKGNYYNIVAHEFGNIFQKQFPNLIYPDLSEISWDELEKIAPFDQQQISALIGLPILDKWPILVHHYIYYQDEMAKVIPSTKSELDRIFGYSAK